MTIFYCGSLISNAFGGLIAASILDSMKGKRCLDEVVYLEGSVTIFVALCSTIHPSRLSFRHLVVIASGAPTCMSAYISPKTLAILKAREKKGQIQVLKLAVTDWKVWWLAVNMASFMIELLYVSSYFYILL